MVYFECQKCNESLKKPKVAKHLQHCNSGFVSCIDCSKVFAWNEWEAHTSCMSESQKYQGKDYQAKEKENKGAKKQDAWTDNVRERINDPSIAPHIRSNLEKLMIHDNIPRKQKPFANFVKNSLKIWNEKQINEIWDVIAAANTKPNAANTKPAGADGTTPGTNGVVAWVGWKRAFDDELRSNGGEMPWKRLRDSVVSAAKRGKEAGTEDELECRALASIPDAYLSKEDELVRLPKAA